MCMVTECKSGYHVYNNACEADSVSNCGSHGKECKFDNAADGGVTCESKQCKLNKCTANYYVLNNVCKPNDLNNCGSYGRACDILHAAVQKCTAGNCIATSCESGYHLYDKACEKNDNTNCGSHGKGCTTASFENSATVQCSTSGACELKSCARYAKRVGNVCNKVCATTDTYCPSDGGDMCCKRSSCTGQCIQAL